MESPIELVREILSSKRENRHDKWNLKLREYMKEIRISDEDLNEMNKLEIKDRVRERDTEKWKEEISKKPKARLYKEYKGEIKEEKIYDNTFASELLFGARSNSLNLNDTRKHSGGVVICDVCGEEEEDLIHFMVRCGGLEGRRDRRLMDKFRGKNNTETTGRLFFHTKKDEIEKLKKMIRFMWTERSLGKSRRKKSCAASGGGV